MTTPRIIETNFGPAQLIAARPGYIHVRWCNSLTIDGREYASASVTVSSMYITAEATVQVSKEAVRLVTPPTALKDEGRRLYSLHAPPMF